MGGPGMDAGVGKGMNLHGSLDVPDMITPAPLSMPNPFAPIPITQNKSPSPIVQ